MGILGNIVGGVIGFAVGGPIGAIAGVTIANRVDKAEQKTPISAYEHKESIFDGTGSFISTVNGIVTKQLIIKTLYPGQNLLLKREENNKYDCNTIKVCTENSLQLGYLPKETSDLLGEYMDKGNKYKAEVLEIRGNGKSCSELSIIIRKNDELTVGIRNPQNNKNANIYTNIETKNPNLYSKKNKTECYNYEWNVENFGNEDDVYARDSEGEVLIFRPVTIKVDRRYGELNKLVNGELITVNTYLSCNNMESIGCSLKYVIVKVIDGSSTCGSTNEKIQTPNDLLIKLINEYRESIIDGLGYSQILINESNIYDPNDDYSYFLAKNAEAEYNCNNSSDRDPDMWDQGDINEYYGYDRDYDGDLY